MNEKDLILTKGIQPIAKITDKDLDFLIGREFPNDREIVKVQLNKIKSDSQGGKNRISASVLKLANKDLNKIDSLVKRANEDFRDIITEAEYPRAIILGLGQRDNNQSKDDYLRDWEEYSAWKDKN